MVFTYKKDGFVGKLYSSDREEYKGKLLIMFGGSDGEFEITKKMAELYSSKGVSVLAFAYVNETDLPKAFVRIPIDMLEAAAKRMHTYGYRKIAVWGISKGAELELVAASLLPGLIHGVIAVSPMSIVNQGFSMENGVELKMGSSWTFHGRELPYTSYGVSKFPMGRFIWNCLKSLDVTMYDLYEPSMTHPDEKSIIKVENIQGPILLLSSKMDRMWPSELACEQMMERLKEKEFPYSYQHISYEHGSHLLVPLELKEASFYKGSRKYPKENKEVCQDSMNKALEFMKNIL